MRKPLEEGRARRNTFKVMQIEVGAWGQPEREGPER